LDDGPAASRDRRSASRFPVLYLPIDPIILQQMEKFKACEKEMKTKAFSKEGLIQSAKLDPKAQEKLEQTQWLQTCVEELLLQVETAEAEIETLQQGARKKGKVGATAQERLDELERLNERRKWHISRLEIMLRLLDNGTLSTEQVQGLKEDVNYFVEDNAVRGALHLMQTASSPDPRRWETE
jgi:CCR4-NOT transcription complex subunit 3